jgi:hypothetical protein
MIRRAQRFLIFGILVFGFSSTPASTMLHAQSMFGPGKTVTISTIEISLDGSACSVMAYVEGNSTPLALRAKKPKDCKALISGLKYAADIRSVTSATGGTPAHFHDGWICAGNDCYDYGTYLIPAKAGDVVTVISFDIHVRDHRGPVKLVNIRSGY